MAAAPNAPWCLANDAQHRVGPVDGADPRFHGLANAQSAGTYDGEAVLWTGLQMWLFLDSGVVGKIIKSSR